MGQHLAVGATVVAAAGSAAHDGGEGVHQQDDGEDDAALLEKRARYGDQHHAQHQHRQLHPCAPALTLNSHISQSRHPITRPTTGSTCDNTDRCQHKAVFVNSPAEIHQRQHDDSAAVGQHSTENRQGATGI